jgi:poly-beta-1,6-N-acetyl-D-glucosamine synthase
VTARLSYAVVTPVRNERENLAALEECLAAQATPPDRWLIVDDGSTDGTPDLAREAATRHGWVHVLSLEARSEQRRGGPVVRSFEAGVRALGELPDVVVKVDADVTFAEDYFHRLLAVFADEPGLGIASGVCHELEDGEWKPIFGTRSHVWGAMRAYRRPCLELVMPLEEREGWDELDALKARLEGWSTRVVGDLPFQHHRKMGQRDGSRKVWLAQGETAHYMGYRFSYLLVRMAYRVVREPEALLMLVGWGSAAIRRRPRLADARVREYLREQQRIRKLPLRARETRGAV